MTSAYRPRNADHDYYGCGTYLITLVVSGRERLLSHFVADFAPLGTEQVELAKIDIISSR